MKEYQQKVKPDKILQQSMKWEEAYKQLLDEIYYPGFAQQLIKEDPAHYQREYKAFIDLYDGPQ